MVVDVSPQLVLQEQILNLTNIESWCFCAVNLKSADVTLCTC